MIGISLLILFLGDTAAEEAEGRKHFDAGRYAQAVAAFAEVRSRLPEDRYHQLVSQARLAAGEAALCEEGALELESWVAPPNLSWRRLELQGRLLLCVMSGGGVRKGDAAGSRLRRVMIALAELGNDDSVAKGASDLLALRRAIHLGAESAALEAGGRWLAGAVAGPPGPDTTALQEFFDLWLGADLSPSLLGRIASVAERDLAAAILPHAHLCERVGRLFERASRPSAASRYYQRACGLRSARACARGTEHARAVGHWEEVERLARAGLRDADHVGRDLARYLERSLIQAAVEMGLFGLAVQRADRVREPDPSVLYLRALAQVRMRHLHRAESDLHRMLALPSLPAELAEAGGELLAETRMLLHGGLHGGHSDG